MVAESHLGARMRAIGTFHAAAAARRFSVMGRPHVAKTSRVVTSAWGPLAFLQQKVMTSETGLLCDLWLALKPAVL